MVEVGLEVTADATALRKLDLTLRRADSGAADLPRRTRSTTLAAVSSVGHQVTAHAITLGELCLTGEATLAR
jgi:hypothetical protein